MTFKIFVSHSTKDLSQVEHLRQQLRDTPIEVFVAEHSISASQELAPAIASAISSCNLFVLLWSENAKKSDWVSQEIGHASALRKQILPLVLTEGIALPGFIQGLKHIAIHGDPKESLVAAKLLIVTEYDRQAQRIASAVKEKKDQDALALIGISAFLLWAFSK